MIDHTQATFHDSKADKKLYVYAALPSGFNPEHKDLKGNVDFWDFDPNQQKFTLKVPISEYLDCRDAYRHITKGDRALRDIYGDVDHPANIALQVVLSKMKDKNHNITVPLQVPCTKILPIEGGVDKAAKPKVSSTLSTIPYSQLLLLMISPCSPS
jgi:hypothetical protein